MIMQDWMLTYDAEVEKTMHEHPLAKYKMKNAIKYCAA